jgi:hypothetical protein
MEEQKDKVAETLSDPDFIQAGDFGELLAGRFYPETSLTRKYVVVVYKETSAHEGFVMTAYLTNRPSKRRETIWRR